MDKNKSSSSPAEIAEKEDKENDSALDIEIARK
jgi:hypothetical protein